MFDTDEKAASQEELDGDCPWQRADGGDASTGSEVRLALLTDSLDI